MLMPRILGENLFDNFFEDFYRPVKREPAPANYRAEVMRTDVKESENGYELAIDLPGYKKEDVQAELKDGYLTISATMNRNNDEKDEHGKYIRRERYTGMCSRSFFVGEHLTQEDIKARFENGVLMVDVPKKEAKPEIEDKKYIMID